MRILVIDDEEAMRHMLSIMLKKEGYEVVCAEGAGAALEVLDKEGFEFVLCDIRMPGIDGLEFLKRLKEKGIDATVIMMSAYGTIDTAIECMKLGAYDYISKPFKTDEITLTLRKAQERERLRRENERLKRHDMERYPPLYARDRRMLEIVALIDRIADYDTTVLITGETGTGKELVARTIHTKSRRRDAPFVPVNCGAIPEGLMESELFGHMKGAFTDAVRTRGGLFHVADGGTIFLDEVGELPKELQVKLLRVLQEGEVRRVGDTKTTKVDVRVIAATSRDLEAEIKAGRFREDLYYRLNVIPIRVPPLRERKADIGLLAGFFLERYSNRYAKRIQAISHEAMELLLAYHWPGNVRELENVMERAVILEDNETITPESLPIFRKDRSDDYRDTERSYPPLSIKRAEEELEKRLIKKALEITGGNRTKAAKLLEISHRALLYKIKDYGL